MKNEVKKKMMMDSRKLWHQSHDERISSTNVNHYFAENVRGIPSCDLVDRTMTESFQLHERQNLQSRSRTLADALTRVKPMLTLAHL
jgi:hypothetical protein